MGRLLKVYLKNIFQQKTYYICMGISLVMTIILPFILGLFIKTTDTITFADRVVDCFKIDLIVIIFIALFVCSDFTDGTAKNFIARGYTRRQILYGKYIASLISIFAYFLVGLLFTFIFFAKDGINLTSTDFLKIIAALVTAVATTGLYVIISNTAEKISTAIIITILLFTSFGLMLDGIEHLLKLKFDLSNYWIANLNNLMTVKNAGIMDLLKVVGVAGIYLVILFELSNFIIKKKEVK